MSDDSDLSSQKQKKLSKKRSNSPMSRQNSFQAPPVSQALSQIMSRGISQVMSQHSNSPKIINPVPVPVPVIQDQTGLYDQNRKLRRKLKQLSIRLDQQLQRAAQNKLKQQSIQKNSGHPVSLSSQSLQLQSAHKMIERLQKTVHDYESKESYQITLKRVMDLQGIIKKKDKEIEDLKTEVKTLKKMTKDKEKHVEELLQNSKKMSNPTQDMEIINKLKAKLKKTAEQNEQLRKKQLQKHQKLVKAQHRIIDLQQNGQLPIGKEQGLLQQIEQGKKKYKQAMQRIQRQNIYISKLNEKLSKEGHQKSRKSERNQQKHNEKTQRRIASHSLEDLPSLPKKINTSQLLAHLPSPKQGANIRRY